MGKISQALPPFLGKLILLTKNVDSAVSYWSSDGSVYVVKDEQKFNDVLKEYFKGNSQTFIRQLHFYGFRKVDSSEGVWGFEHEKKLFRKDNLELVKDIRRKTKIDPETQKLASYYEVQALKSQVSFLQSIIEDLRCHLDNIQEYIKSDNTSLPVFEKTVIKSESFISETPKPNTKRQRNLSRNLSNSSFDRVCASIIPPKQYNDQKNSSLIKKEKENEEEVYTSLKSLKSMNSLCSFDSIDLQRMDSKFDLELETGSLSGMLSELDISDSELEQSFTYLENENRGNRQSIDTEVAVRLISEATKVDERDVEKVINYLKQMSIKDNLQAGVGEQSLQKSEMNWKYKMGLSGFESLNEMLPLRTQKVGAN